MRKLMFLVVITSSILSPWKQLMSLNPAPDTLTQYHEIAALYPEDIPNAWNNLSTPQKIFVYYLYRASLPFDRIAAQQLHRHTLPLLDMFETIFCNADILREMKRQLPDIDIEQFLNETERYLMYLWSMHTPYFLREMSNNKRTLNRINCTAITHESLNTVLSRLQYPNAAQKITEVHDTLFNDSVEQTLTVAGSIDESAVNVYAPDVTDEDYEKLPDEYKNKLNAYFFRDEHGDVKMQPYAIGQHFGPELEISAFWLGKAMEHAEQHPDTFDMELIESLRSAITYYQSGDEEEFKTFSRHWLRSKNPINHNTGFIETYEDPHDKRGGASAEITVQTIDLKALSSILPDLERKLPFPKEYKRESIDTLPNASIDTQLFGGGHYGPAYMIAAYCLPNYGHIRNEEGSRQIIYASTKGLGSRLNPHLARHLFLTREQAEWREKYDADRKLGPDLWDAHVILHETVGHGSGSPAIHTFQEGENLTVDGVTYNVGDTIPVTSENITPFLQPYAGALEELRAEIVALYISINHIDELKDQGVLHNWYYKYGRKTLQEWIILSMAYDGLGRLLLQPPTATKMEGAHSLANNTITNFLVQSGGLEFVEEQIEHEGTSYDTVGIRIKDFDTTVHAITELAQLVQEIKSTANGVKLRKLMETHGHPINQKYLNIMHTNHQAITGDLKMKTKIYPLYEPVLDEKKESLRGVDALWPSSFADGQFRRNELMMSKELQPSLRQRDQED